VEVEAKDKTKVKVEMKAKVEVSEIILGFKRKCCPKSQP
jgi:hypothetical protein